MTNSQTVSLSVVHTMHVYPVLTHAPLPLPSRRPSDGDAGPLRPATTPIATNRLTATPTARTTNGARREVLDREEEEVEEEEEEVPGASSRPRT